MKKTNIKTLLSLYSSYVLQKTTNIILIISFILIFIFLYFSSRNLVDTNYLISYEDYHLSYFTQSILVIQIFNSIITCVIAYTLAGNAITFDSLFLSYIPRRKITCAKIIVIVLLVLNVVLLEEILILGIGLLNFSRLIIEYDVFLSFIYLYISLLFEVGIYLLLSSLNNNIFVCMIGLFISLISKVIINNYKNIYKILKDFIPLIMADNFNIVMDNSLISILYIVLIYILYGSIYSIKDIKY